MKENNVLALIVAYYISRFDRKFLYNLNFKTFKEAYEVIGEKLTVKPSTIKNMRDEFDPIHPNDRKGWYQRELSPSRLAVIERYNVFSEDALTEIVKDIIYGNLEDNIKLHVDRLNYDEKLDSTTRTFTTRGITGKLAEELFLKKFYNGEVMGLTGELLDTRELGCGYDFEMLNDPQYMFEVKGLLDEEGSINFTDKEWTMAKKYGSKYFLVLISGIEKEPSMQIVENPYSILKPKKYIYETIAVNWIVDANTLNRFP